MAVSVGESKTDLGESNEEKFNARYQGQTWEWKKNKNHFCAETDEEI